MAETIQSAVSEEYKICSTCKQPIKKQNDDGSMNFSSRSASKDGLAYSCKACERQCASKSYKNKKKKKRERQYYKDNREHLLELSTINYEQNKETRLAQSKTYRQTYPKVAREANKKRRELIKKNKGEPYTREEVIAEATINGVIICAICGLAVHPNDVHIDHKIPIAQGGLDCKTNVQVTHKRCNLKRPKDARDLTKSQN